ncbi:copper-translocating P-type ATPase [Sanyastnella coralliicola]|uniref:copper-translocating P-type ATPase n=1 Tax=Sanyastnella coralliicola TaxID=3069118 RepID=UPI0027B9DC14|nr:copper-translocating P-type ATPase [Longitalea sp. SCSIO 12813]
MEHQHKKHSEHQNHSHHNHHTHQGHEHQGYGQHGGNPPHGHAHHDHHKMMIEDFKKRFWVSLVISIPVLVLSPMIQDFMGFELVFNGNLYVLFALSSLAFFYGGWPFLKGLKDEVKKGALGMMTLIAVAITVAYAYSTAVVFGLEGKMFFWELVTLIDIMLVGHWIEMKSVLGASKALELLVSMMPSEAYRISGDGSVEKVKLDELQKGDHIQVKPGAQIPADGLIFKGESHLNESMLTGESKPVKKREGDTVIGGAINGNGTLRIEVKGAGKDSYLNKVITMVREAQKTKSKTQNLADRAAKWLTYIALTVGFGTLVVWIALGFDFVYALERMVTVMIISCPHALGLAVPLVVAISTTISAQNGLLIRNRTAFENSRRISIIVFDKTGTLTQGSHEVIRIVPLQDGINERELLRLATAVEQYSEHHIAKGLLRKAKSEGISIPHAEDFKYEPGIGVSAIVEGQKIEAGGNGILKKINRSDTEYTDSSAETKVFFLSNGEIIGFVSFADQIRKASFGAIKTLHKNNIKTLLLTGDSEDVAQDVANRLAMNKFMANVLPHEKQEKLRELQAQGEFVAMAGDGVNDAPALAQADVGIAVGSGADIAAETADIILVNSDPQDIVNLILFGKVTYRKMIQNLIWALGYNVLTIPLAAGVLYSYGFVLEPAIGAIFMILSTIIVALNAQILKNKIKKSQINI